MNQDIQLIWHRFHKELKQFIVSKVGNTTDADDILQDTFVKIIQNIEKVQNAKNLKQYLFGIVRNTTIDHFRNQKTNGLSIQQPIVFTEKETESLNTTIADCCITSFIQQLPDKYKEALLITEFQNISQKELAERLNISHSGAKSRVQRGRAKLKQLILNCCTLKSDTYGNLTDEAGHTFPCS